MPMAEKVAARISMTSPFRAATDLLRYQDGNHRKARETTVRCVRPLEMSRPSELLWGLAIVLRRGHFGGWAVEQCFKGLA